MAGRYRRQVLGLKRFFERHNCTTLLIDDKPGGQHDSNVMSIVHGVLNLEHPSGAPTLLLAHNPDTRLQLGDYPWDLMLSGHTYGGQIVIPVLGYAPFVPIKDRRFTEGLRLWRGRHVHVTRGMGNILGVRLNCRPEVSLLTLAPEAAGA